MPFEQYLKVGWVPQALESALQEAAGQLARLETQTDARLRFEGVCRVMRKLGQDHRRITTPLWRPLTLSPRAVGPAIKMVYDALKRLRLLTPVSGVEAREISERVQGFNNLLQSMESHWIWAEEDEHAWSFFGGTDRMASVITFPVVADQERGGFCYLMAQPESHRPTWNFFGFSDHETIYDYLDPLGALAISLVTGASPQDIPPEELGKLQADFVYRPLYGASVSEGQSHTGAVLVLFTLCYLYARLRQNAFRLAAIRQQICVSAEVRANGSLGKVSGLREKLRAVLDQWGDRLAVLVAEANRIEVEQILREEPPLRELAILYARDARDLVEKMIGPLDEMHREWLKQVRRSEYEQTWKPILPHQDQAAWEQWETGEIAGQTASPVGTSPALVRLRRNHLGCQVRVGFSETAFHNESGRPLRRGVVLAISGCAALDDHNPEKTTSPDSLLWDKPEQPLMTQCVYEVLRAVLHSPREDGASVFIHFLSERRPVIETAHPLHGREISEILAARRQELRLDSRGRFLRPILDYWLGPPSRCSQFDSLELYIVSNCEIPDLADEVVEGRLPGFSLVKRILVGGIDTIHSWINLRETDVLVSLRPDGQELTRTDRQNLAVALGRLPHAIRSLALDLGKNCPRGWNDMEGLWTLSRPENGHFVLSAGLADGRETVSLDAEFELGDHATIDLNLEYIHTEAEQRTVKTAQARRLGFSSGPHLEWPKPDGGLITPAELARLGQTGWCLFCAHHQQDPHHMCCEQQPTAGRYRLSLDTLHAHWNQRQQRPGFYAVRLADGEWKYHRSNLRLDEAHVVVCGGQLLMAPADQPPHEPGPLTEDTYQYQDTRGAWLIFKV